MAANGAVGGQSSFMDAAVSRSTRGVKKEEEIGPKPILLHENIHDHDVESNHDTINNKGISIAERRAAKCGFNVSNIMNEARFRTSTGLVPPVRSPYFTVPPGISPSALLDSPIMLPNAQAQLSPTTGTFQFPAPNSESLNLKLKLISTNEADQSSSNNLKAENKLSNSVKRFEEFEYQNMGKKDIFEDGLSKIEVLENKFDHQLEDKCLILHPNNSSAPINYIGRNQMSSSDINDHSSKEKHPKTAATYFPNKEITAKYSEDGYYWRKYGQKHVKGSEFPRSYYKCTNTNCPVKKKVERSHDGQITEIVYKGSHNHSKPDQAFKRPGSDQLSEITEGGSSGSCIKHEAGKDLMLSSSTDCRLDMYTTNNGLDHVASSTSFLNDLSRPFNTTTFEPATTIIESQEFSSTFNGQSDGNHDQDEASLESISINDIEDDDNGTECEPKKRKRESFPNEIANPRSTREPRVVVQIESDIDILDDGYRWRKYGQKVVKGNPNPRSYYKCTTPGCPVRKHVERAANDIKSVITTYEGKHNHEVPCSKTGSLVISNVADLPSTVTNTTVSSTPSSLMTIHKQDATTKAAVIGKQMHHHHHHDIPLYNMDRKPMLNYNELMRSTNLPNSSAATLITPTDHLSFGASSIYPLSFPPFHSLPYGSQLMVNGTNNHMMKNYTNNNPPPNLYPMMMPDYMSLPSPINNHVSAASTNNVPAGVSGNFHFGNYSTLQNSVRGQQEIIRECHSKIIMKPKEEKREVNGDVYNDAYFSTPNRGNG